MSFPQTSSAAIWQLPSVLTSTASHLPAHCEPTSPFLLRFSSTFHTCIPTPLAFISTLLGCLSVLAWLFAQLPQIIKNHRLRSTSGLSIYFLVEWCLGDMSNLVGAILTHQATWQITIAAYYCFVDVALVSQWTWFDFLCKGKSSKTKGKSKDRNSNADRGDEHKHLPGGMKQIEESTSSPTSPGAKQIPTSSLKQSLFRTPNYGSIQSTSSAEHAYADSATPSGPRIAMPRLQHNFPFPSPSPRTTLFLTLLLAMASVHASPATPPPSLSLSTTHGGNGDGLASRTPSLGTLFSWMSTVLYVCSRLPQLLKNFSRRSTAGLSPLLFLAAFFGNFFYSSSMLCNPSLWADLGPYGGGGWVGPDGSARGPWALAALPFFIGTAGVLFMDAGVGVQFWLWGDGRPADVDVDADVGGSAGPKRRWSERTRGWMRGWVPSGGFGSIRQSFGSSSSLASSLAAAPNGAGVARRAGEEEALLAAGSGNLSSR